MSLKYCATSFVLNLRTLNLRTFRIFNTTLHNFLALKSGKQRFKHCAGRLCSRDFNLFSPLNSKFSISLNNALLRNISLSFLPQSRS